MQRRSRREMLASLVGESTTDARFVTAELEIAKQATSNARRQQRRRTIWNFRPEAFDASDQSHLKLSSVASRSFHSA